VLINGQTLVNALFHPLGVSLDPVPAMINHSCAPNAVISFSGACMRVSAIEHIAADREITISYIDNTNKREDRQLELSQRYHFDCKCRYCVNEPHLTLGQKDSIPVGLVLLNAQGWEARRNQDMIGSRHLFGMVHQQPTEASEEHFDRVADAIDVYLNDPLYAIREMWRQPRATLQSQAVLHLLHREQFLPALIISLQSYYFIDPVHFPFAAHPVRVVHAYVLAKLAHYILYLDWVRDRKVASFSRDLNLSEKRWMEASYALLAEVNSAIDTSHGAESRLTAQVHAEAREAMRVSEAVPFLKGDGKGIRGQHWRDIEKVATEGWQWYDMWVSTGDLPMYC